MGAAPLGTYIILNFPPVQLSVLPPGFWCSSWRLPKQLTITLTRSQICRCCKRSCQKYRTSFFGTFEQNIQEKHHLDSTNSNHTCSEDFPDVISPRSRHLVQSKRVCATIVILKTYTAVKCFLWGSVTLALCISAKSRANKSQSSISSYYATANQEGTVSYMQLLGKQLLTSSFSSSI